MSLEFDYFVTGGDVTALPFFYDWQLVGLSLTIAMVCSMAASQVATIAAGESRAKTKEALLITGSVSLGFGVWAMHFIGMLSFNLCTPVSYLPSWTAASMVPSLLASYVALKTITHMRRLNTYRLLLGGLVTGAGIGLMHYSGMEAMQMRPVLRYDPFYFALSLVVAVGLATFAIWIRFGLAALNRGLSTLKLNGLSGAVMGLAIAGMHYTGMLAARFIGEADAGRAADTFPTSLGLALFASVAVFAVFVLGSISLWHVRNISGRLNLQSERLATILNSVASAMITTDRRGLILEFNQEAQKIFACTPAEVLGLPIAPLLLALHDLPREGAPKDAGPSETVATRKGGEKFPVQLAWGQASVNHETLYIACLSDLTQAKAQRANLERAYAIIEASQDAIISKTLDGVITSWNQGAERMFGYAASEAIGQSMLFVIPAERKDEEREFLSQIARGERIDSFETVRLNKSGKSIDVAVTLSPIRGPLGNVVGVSKIATDIGDRKAAEALRKERERAGFADAARTELMVSMNHEIRTPLSHIEGFANVLLDGPLQPDQVHSVESIQHSARQLQADLNNILQSVETSSGRAQLHKTRFNFHALIRQLDQAFRAQASARQIEWTTEFDRHQDGLFFGDEAKIRQILDRLLANAFKFTDKGSVALRLSRSATQLEVAISDTGCGMDAQQLESLFKPLRQADPSMGRRHQGMGMGCALSMQLARLMGGSIQVKSVPGLGSCLTLRLPLEPDLAAAPGPAPDYTARLSILAVDDIPLNLRLVSALLKSQHTVTTALGAQEAFQALREQDFDVILMDVQMPGMDGLAATRAIRRQEQEEGRPPVCIIALTANVSEADRSNALEAGMDDFLAKPLTRQRLHECLAKLRISPAQPAASA